MKRKAVLSCITLILILVGAIGGSAITRLTLAESGSVSIPQTINYQGLLTDKETGEPMTGTVDIIFSLYDVPSGGTPTWTETHSVLSLKDGLFNVRLGSVNPISISHLNGESYLGIKVGTDDEMTPRQLLTSVPYAFHAENADTVDGMDSTDFATGSHEHDAAYINEGQANSISGAMIQSSAVSSNKVSFTYAGSQVKGGKATDAGMLDGLDNTQFMRSDKDTSTSGNLEVGGVVQTSGVTYTSPRTHYYSISRIAFTPRSSDIDYSKYSWAGTYTTAADGILDAPVYLPHGAVVTQMEVFFRVLDPPSSVEVSFYRQGLSGASPSALAVVDSSGLAYGYGSNSTNFNQTIDNTTYAYLVSAQWPDGADGVGINSVLLTYEISEAQ